MLVPVVGIVVLAVVLTIIVIVFCVAQSGKIMDKVKSKTAGSILSFPSHRGASPHRASSRSTIRSPHLRGNLNGRDEREEMGDEISLSSDTSSDASLEVLPAHQFHHQSFPPSFLHPSVHTSQEYISSGYPNHNYGVDQNYSDIGTPVYEDDDSSVRVTPFPLQRILESPVQMLQRTPLHSPTRFEHSHGYARGAHLRATSPVRGSRYSVGRLSGR